MTRTLVLLIGSVWLACGDPAPEAYPGPCSAETLAEGWLRETTTYTYDDDGRLTLRVTTTAMGEEALRITTTWHDDGARTSRVEQPPSPVRETDIDANDNPIETRVYDRVVPEDVILRLVWTWSADTTQLTTSDIYVRGALVSHSEYHYLDENRLDFVDIDSDGDGSFDQLQSVQWEGMVADYRTETLADGELVASKVLTYDEAWNELYRAEDLDGDGVVDTWITRTFNPRDLPIATEVWTGEGVASANAGQLSRERLDRDEADNVLVVHRWVYRVDPGSLPATSETTTIHDFSCWAGGQ